MTIHTPATAAYTPTSRRANRTLIGTFKSAKRHHAVTAATADRWNRAHHPAPYLTVAGYMTDTLRMDREDARRYAPPLGGHVRKAYAAKFGHAPTDTVLVVVGRGPALAHPRIAPATAYEPGDIAVLDAGARNYKRTAALLNGAS
jgi:hypothetical protein